MVDIRSATQELNLSFSLILLSILLSLVFILTVCLVVDIVNSARSLRTVLSQAELAKVTLVWVHMNQ